MVQGTRRKDREREEKGKGRIEMNSDEIQSNGKERQGCLRNPGEEVITGKI